MKILVTGIPGRRTISIIIFACIISSPLIASAQSKAKTQPDPITFENVYSTSKINFRLDNGTSPHKYQPETMAGGVALFDYDNDGLLDLYFTNGASLPNMDKSDPKF